MLLTRKQEIEVSDMSERKRTALNAYLEREITQCKLLEQELTMEERRDEAVFARVRKNVLEIFQTVLNAAVKTAEGDEGKTRDFFALKIEEIPKNWRVSLQKAEAHGDGKTAHIENVKLETAAGIKKVFERIWEEAL